MYIYTWYQWLLFFFIYCFIGWIIESTYVSLKCGHFVNRGFLRLPLNLLVTQIGEFVRGFCL